MRGALGDYWAARHRNTLKEEQRIRKALGRGRISPGEACARAEATRTYWEARLQRADATGERGMLLLSWLSAGQARTLCKFLALVAGGEDLDRAEVLSGHQQSIEVMGFYLEALDDADAPAELTQRFETELADLWGLPAPAGINA